MKQFFTFLFLALSISTKAQQTYCYEDKDRDGYGDPSTAVAATIFGCPSEFLTGVAWVNNGLDCDDNNANVNPAIRWYRDADGDGYHDNTYITSCVNPGSPYYLLNNLAGGGDCNDADNTINPLTAWGYDNDGDGWFSTTKSQCEWPGPKWSRAPQLLQLDCDDNDPAIHNQEYWYLDGDHDGYPGSLLPVGPFCTGAPANYRRASEMITTSVIDCNDQNSAVTTTRYYKDADDDGYSDGTFLSRCIAPTGHYTTTPARDANGNVIVDCNDNDAVEHNPFQAWHKDDDGDKHGASFPVEIQCHRPAGYFAASELISTDDCNDHDPSVWQSGTLYIDSDEDGWDNGQQTLCYGNVPAGYALTTHGSDCDDNDPILNPGTTWYKDLDNDGYSNGTSGTTGKCERPLGFKLASELIATSGDCDDDDATINPGTIWYKDVDNDGYGDGSTQTQCTRPTNYKLPSELTATIGDCDDGNAILNPATVWYKDADDDGYSNGTTQKQCTRSAGYKLASELTATIGDCDDNNDVLKPTTVWYKDADNDGYGSGAALTQCTRPTNYKLASELTATSGDCNDNDPAISPAAVEVCGNKVDDNCNGVVDENTCYACQNGSNLTSANISSNSAQINWNAVANPQQWQLQYKSIAPGAKWIDVLLTGNIRSVKISSLKANQSYNWHIRAKCNGAWTSYSISQSFKTLPASQTVARAVPEENLSGNMQVRAIPNPTNTNFNIILKGFNQNEEIKMLVVDLYGRIIEQRMLATEQTITLGDKYRPGVYIVKFMQGDQNKQLKLIKLPN